jgi:acyl-CoA synthetase (AMP-forming)/AMP-acid ligase II
LGEGQEVKTISYSDAQVIVDRRSRCLRGSGLRRGDPVGILGRATIDFALTVLAILKAGGVVVLLSPEDPGERTAGRLEFTESRFLIHDEALERLAESAASDQRLFSFQDLDCMDAAREVGAIRMPAATDAAVIVFTSGTTSAPKAVVQSHYAVWCNAHMLARHHRIRPGLRLLCVLPLHHVNGLEFTIFASMVGGGHAVLAGGFDLLGFWSVVRRHDIHVASLVPNLLRVLARRSGWRGQEPIALRYVVSAAAPLSTALSRDTWDRLGLRIVQGYGLSEVTNFSTSMPVDLVDADYDRWMLAGARTSVGPALPGQEVSVEVPETPGRSEPGQEGEVVIRGPCVMSGYLHEPVATDTAFRGDWFHTGDLGYCLDDGNGLRYVHITGRKRDIAKRSGLLVSLIEVDEVLAAIPGVADAGCAAFGNTWVGEEIGAVVVLEPGIDLSELEILRSCRLRLPYAAVPKRVELIDSIPRTDTGKIVRSDIAGYFAPYRDQAFVESALLHERELS